MVPGWYSDNARRSFPLTQTPGLPAATLLDCGIMFGPLGSFIPGTHRAWLGRITRTSGTLVFSFYTDAPALLDWPLQFVVNEVTEEIQTVWNDGQLSVEDLGLADSANSESGAVECVESADWSGFLTVGDLTELLDELNAEESWVFPDDMLPLEPRCIQSLAGQYVTQLHVINLERTRSESPEGCRPLCYNNGNQDIFVVETCLQGPVRFVGGYNCHIRQDDLSNMLTFEASDGAGQGEPCGEPRLFAAEEPPIGRSTLDGGLRCNETIRSLGGVDGPIVRILAGDGVTITPNQEAHQLIVDIDLHNVPSITESAIETEESCSADADVDESSSCDCGEL